MTANFDSEHYIARFHEHFVDPDNAAFPLDKEEDTGYAWQTSRYSTEDALLTLFEGELTEAQLADLAADLNGEYPYWAKRSDLDTIQE